MINDIEFTAPLTTAQPDYLQQFLKLCIENKVKYVVDTKNVKIVEKTGIGYSSAQYSVEDNLSKDGRYLSIPQTHIFEIKDLDLDIKGVAV